MKITLKDVAKKSGFTVATVSRALNDSDMVSAKTKVIIRETAEEMGYIKNVIAQGLVKKHMDTVGIIVPDITNPYFPVLIKGMQDELIKHGYTTFLCNSNAKVETEQQLIKLLCGLRVRGIIMDPLCDDSALYLHKQSPDTPAVFVSNIPKGDNINYISIDNYKGAFDATKYLIGLGHKSIAYLGGNDGTYTYKRRCDGFCSAMKEHYGSVDKNFVKEIPSNRVSGYNTVTDMILSGNMPTAFFSSNDDIAMGVLECLIQHGFNIPEDISLIGFDDIEYASLPGINLTTVHEPRYQVGCQAAKIILNLFEDNSETHQIIVEPELTLRSTCAKAKYHR